MRDTLFILAPPFEDVAYPGKIWFCVDCATMEGALQVNPHWAAKIDVRRIAFARPRADVIALIGEAHQGCPKLVLGSGSQAPADAHWAGERAFLDGPKAILRYLAETYGGAGPHP